MKIHKEYRKLEHIEEVSIYDVYESELYQPAEKKYELEKIPFQKIMSNLSTDINIFIPFRDGNDFIIHGLGSNVLERGKISQEEVTGRLLSECSPMFHKLLYESFTIPGGIFIHLSAQYDSPVLTMMYFMEETLTWHPAASGNSDA